MKVLTFIPRSDLQRRVAKALTSDQFVVETVVTAKDCLQFTRFAPYDGVLVDADSLVFGDIVLLVKLLRQENPDILTWSSVCNCSKPVLTIACGNPSLPPNSPCDSPCRYGCARQPRTRGLPIE
jgi:hypothetical protein